jgi:hypothetical protein
VASLHKVYKTTINQGFVHSAESMNIAMDAFLLLTLYLNITISNDYKNFLPRGKPLSEISQFHRNSYHMFSLICGS